MPFIGHLQDKKNRKQWVINNVKKTLFLPFKRNSTIPLEIIIIIIIIIIIFYIITTLFISHNQ